MGFEGLTCRVELVTDMLFTLDNARNEINKNNKLKLFRIFVQI
jgi:hypothetical protein